MLNGCVRLGTDVFNSKEQFFNRALDKFSEYQYNMSFHVQKFQMVGRTYQVKRNKGGEKTMGGKIGRKERKKGRKKRKKKVRKKEKSTEQKERKGEGRGEGKKIE